MLQLKYFLKFIGADYEVCIISFGKIRKKEVPPFVPHPPPPLSWTSILECVLSFKIYVPKKVPRFWITSNAMSSLKY